jgi:hypothetical protein
MSVNELIDAGQFALLNAAATRFGSFAVARARAGIRFVPKRPAAFNAWDTEAVVVAIQERHRDGEPLAVTKCPRSLVSAAVRHFSSWREAIASAGFDYDEIVLNRHFDDDELLQWLRDLAKTHPEMTLFDMDKYGGHTVACRRRWGSLEAAAAAAGLVDWPVRTRFEAMSREEIVVSLQRLSRRRTPLSFSRVRDNPTHQRLLNSVMKRFESWDAAMAAAGLPSQRLVREPWTREAILAGLRKWHRETGGRRKGNLQKDVVGLYQACRDHFGSYSKALIAAGLDKPKAKSR